MTSPRTSLSPGTTPSAPLVRPHAAAPEPLLRRLIGAVLRARRREQQRTLREVAAEARVSVAYLSEVERGRKEASSEVLLAICHALGMRLVDLVAEAHRDLLDLTASPGRHHSSSPHRLAVVPGRSTSPARAHGPQATLLAA